MRSLRLPRHAVRVALTSFAAATLVRAAHAAPGRCVEVRDAEARYERILTALERGKPAARLWWIGWTSGYSAATVAQGVLAAATTDRGTRIDSIVGAAESAIGVIGMLAAAPRTPIWASDELITMDYHTACARVRRLRRAEHLLEKSADEEAMGRAWYAQLFGGVVNLAAPVVLWTAYRRYAAGWYTLAPGLAVQEAQVLTQPTAALGAWNAYKVEYGPRRRASVSFAPLPAGAAVVGTF